MLTRMIPPIQHIQDTLNALHRAIAHEIIGQDVLIEKLIVTIFAGGHALLEWVPGLGKTKTIRTIAKILALDHKRISFTPDLLPSDLIGAEIFRPGKGDFSVRKWPIFTHILLADEINRTPPKVQSALLEAMEEKQVTIGDTSFELPSPFIVFATQNPLEYEGTYPLPEAQLDRFLMRIILSYPHAEDEKRIFQVASESPLSCPDSPGNIQLSRDDISEMAEYITKIVRIDTKIYHYVHAILAALRAHVGDDTALLQYWPSTRAGIALIRAARVLAAIRGRDTVMPEDIKYLAHDVLDHRMGRSYRAITEGIAVKQITEKVLDTVYIP